MFDIIINTADALLDLAGAIFNTSSTTAEVAPEVIVATEATPEV